MKKTVISLLLVTLLIGSSLFSATATMLLLGDCNGDNAVNAKDLLLLKQYMAEYPVHPVMAAADCNGDIAVNAKDVLQLRWHLADIIKLGTTEVSDKNAFESESLLGEQPKQLFSDITAPLEIVPESLGSPYAYYYRMNDDGSENYDYNEFAKNPWDLENFGGKIFVASGEFRNNSGPTPIRYFDTGSKNWVDTGKLSTESVTRFYDHDGRLFTFPADPMSEIRFYEYLPERGRWMTHKGINQNILHADSMAFYDNRSFVLTPSNNGGPKISVSEDMETLIDVDFFGKDGQLSALKSAAGIFVVNDRLLVIANFCVFEYNKATRAFHYLNDSIATSRIPSQKALSGKYSYSCSALELYESIGNRIGIAQREKGLVVTDDFLNYRLAVPEPDYQVTDLVKIDESTVCVYASRQHGDDAATAEYSNAVYVTHDFEQFDKLFEYTAQQHSMSIEYENGSFYLGNAVDLGCNRPTNGEIFRVRLYDEK